MSRYKDEIWIIKYIKLWKRDMTALPQTTPKQV